MEHPAAGSPRVATPAQARVIARLLDAFNREYASPTPGPALLEERLRRLLSGEHMFAMLSGEPAVGVALVTLRPSLWYDGPVAVLDELYVAPGVRGRELGSTLLRATETMVRRRGGELLEVNVDDDGSGARRFYERHGYANTEPGTDAPMLYLYRELASAPFSPPRQG